jgi:hypothetical protein
MDRCVEKSDGLCVVSRTCSLLDSDVRIRKPKTGGEAYSTVLTSVGAAKEVRRPVSNVAELE